MRHRIPVLVLAAALTVTPAAAGTSRVTFTPDNGKNRGMILGDGAGPNCGTATVNRSDGGYNNVSANHHWCWSGGAMWDTYGWADNDTCQFICQFNGYDYAYDFGDGFAAKASWSIFGWSPFVLHLHTSATACVAVDGWGNYWGC